MTWHLGPLAAFDLETTGVDVETDRIVTASVLGIRAQRGDDPADDPGRWLSIDRLSWIADPGVEIPAEASALHGITTARAQAEGRPAATVVKGIAAALAEHIRAGTPIVVMNAPYDLTLLDRELIRHGTPALAKQSRRALHVIDPRVLDKEVDRYRKGPRTLSDLCTHYGVRLDGAHEAAADALGAARIAVAIGQQHARIGKLELATLHGCQEKWAARQAEGLAEYFRRDGRVSDAESVRTDWPLIPRQQVAK
ncbi:exonuclease domain-containing protein [Kitasatospora sp. McL0602]|uniref:exonuclease domain-containing protein n=1 Tax=Kitasatospora sp. McL0602 TaxID=3439530 RepID=UPI003F8C7C86